MAKLWSKIVLNFWNPLYKISSGNNPFNWIQIFISINSDSNKRKNVQGLFCSDLTHKSKKICASRQLLFDIFTAAVVV